jgi:Domain of Unknown Function (DUF1080)
MISSFVSRLCILVGTPFLAATLCSASLHAADPGWISLFNGKDLDGWIPKISGYPVGENALQTFRVEDGILKVSYANYEKFGTKFGHLYSKSPYSHYILRMEYRFEGKMMADAPHYVNLNSGVMYHSQSAASQKLDQAFPASLEFQFLADEGKGARSTGNLCTPGTHVHMDGKLVTQHIVESSATTFPADEWVKIELEVHGNEQVIHRVNGKEVLRYQNPVIDPEYFLPAEKRSKKAVVGEKIATGHIALQAEGQGVWFRNIEIKESPVASSPKN